MKLVIALGYLFFQLIASTADAQVVSYTRQSDGVTFKLGDGTMRLYVCRDNIIRVTFCADTILPSKRILTVNEVWGPQSFSVQEDDSSISVSTDRITVMVSKTSSQLKFYSSGGGLILSESSRQVDPVTVYGVSTHSCIGVFDSPADEAIYGLGQHQQGTMNYKGKTLTLAQANMEIAIPVLVSNKGYGLLWDNYSRTVFDATLSSNTKYEFSSTCGEMIDYYFMYGPDIDSVISAYRTATGNAPLFPKWAYGLFQSKNRYMSSSELLSVKDEYRSNNIPVDCIVQDWYYWDPYPWGSHIMNPSYYPDPAAVVDSMHKSNIHTMISIWGVFTQGDANYAEFSAINALYPSSGTHQYYDPHNDTARSIYWRQVRDQLFLKYGWDAWWADADEPDNYPDSYDRNTANTALGKGCLYYNTYPVMHTSGVYDGWRKDVAGKRLFTLSRCAFAGNQRNAAACWSGDIQCSWSAFKSQLSAGLNFCLSGIPYWTTDIGGYSTNWNSTNWATAGNRELFVRWFEYGTFCPIYRIHGVDDKSLMSAFWDARTKNILLSYDKLRYRLMPYIYSLAWKVTSENYTVMRHLIIDYRTDPNVVNIFHQFMFGPSLMINPVYTSGATKRTVYLPAGEWYDFWTGDKIEGGRSVTASAPLDTMPIYVKAGAIIPMGPEIQYATELIDPLEIRVYRGTDGKFNLYEDNGDSYNYELGEYSIIPFSYSEASRQLTIGMRHGSYPAMPAERTFRIVFVDSHHGTGADVTSDCDTVVHYNGAEVIAGINSDQGNIPSRSVLAQNYPNPFNPGTTISYHLSALAHVRLTVFDILGRVVKVLVDEKQPPGEYSVKFDGTVLPSGLYFYRIQSGNFVQTRKALLLK